MLAQAVFSLLAASAVATLSIRGRHESIALRSSSGAIARQIHKCHKPPPPTVYFPLNFRYGSDQKITTDLVIPGSDKTMPVCFDQGSDTYWVLEPGAVFNWGSEQLGVPGACNITATPVYEYLSSLDATDPVPFQYFNAYGGLSKIVLGNATLEDTMTFTSVAGQRSTLSGVRTALANFITVTAAG
ncbi:hypothetical protein O1611_g10306 [Lasiodiplodia mahajangana]|uniref:Uncharacterized protein n=1 Tax=Lasiodiplodia mahajangana TaxID=1108764 RepID=A0ACC2IZT5_9PEZI|nr:hypothetical protein O1611_g10306 [Lasiodiplodia mahajangana]